MKYVRLCLVLAFCLDASLAGATDDLFLKAERIALLNVRDFSGDREQLVTLYRLELPQAFSYEVCRTFLPNNDNLPAQCESLGWAAHDTVVEEMFTVNLQRRIKEAVEAMARDDVLPVTILGGLSISIFGVMITVMVPPAARYLFKTKTRFFSSFSSLVMIGAGVTHYISSRARDQKLAKVKELGKPTIEIVDDYLAKHKFNMSERAKESLSSQMFDLVVKVIRQTFVDVNSA